MTYVYSRLYTVDGKQNTEGGDAVKEYTFVYTLSGTRLSLFESWRARAESEKGEKLSPFRLFEMLLAAGEDPTFTERDITRGRDREGHNAE